MSYSRTNWATGDTVTAEKLNNLETGVETLDTTKSVVSVSATGTATDEVQYITINGTEKKLAGGSGTITDVQVNGTSVVTSGVADIPIANSTTLGAVKPVAKTSSMTGDVGVDSEGKLYVAAADSNKISDTDSASGVNAEVAVSGTNEKLSFSVSNSEVFKVTSVGLNHGNGVNLYDDNENILRFADNSGNVVMKLSADKLQSAVDLDFPNKDNCLLRDKSFWVIGDSLSNSNSQNSWMGKLSALTGGIWYPTKNSGANNEYGPTCKGGTKTCGSGNSWTAGEPCGQLRAHNLVNYYNAGYPVDVVFIQNVNDSSVTIGQSTDIPFMMTQVYTYDSVLSVSSEADAITYFKNNISTILSGVEAQPDTVVLLKYRGSSNTAKKIVINSAATADGTLTLTVGGTSYGITVTSSMSVADINAAILEYDYLDYSDIQDSDDGGIVFTNIHDGTSTLTASAGTTGITYTISDCAPFGYYSVCFNSLDDTDFTTNTEKWVSCSTISLWSAYKGLTEYLLTNIPGVQVYFTLLTHIGIDYSQSSNYRADGSFDMETWAATRTAHTNFYNCQKQVAAYYYLTAYDVEANCGISPANAYKDGYYPVSDVHPNTKGQLRWGSTLARLIAGN